jgi:hypothetical protein
MHCKQSRQLDQLAGAGDERWRHVKAEVMRQDARIRQREKGLEQARVCSKAALVEDLTRERDDARTQLDAVP